MNKSLTWLFIGIGSFIGGWITSLLGAGWLSPWGVIGSMFGGIAGLYVASQMDF